MSSEDSSAEHNTIEDIDKIKGPSKKIHQCLICEKYFTKNQGLNVHLKSVHENLKPFQCDICLSTFGLKGYLNVHVNSVHKKLKPFQCPICLTPFGTK